MGILLIILFLIVIIWATVLLFRAPIIIETKRNDETQLSAQIQNKREDTSNEIVQRLPETEQIRKSGNAKNRQMEKQFHPNFIKSQKLIFVSIGLLLISCFFPDDMITISKKIVFIIPQMVILACLGFLVRQDWVKYLLLILILYSLTQLLGRFADIIIFDTPQRAVEIIGIAQIIVWVWATVLLFSVPKIIETKRNDETQLNAQILEQIQKSENAKLKEYKGIKGFLASCGTIAVWVIICSIIGCIAGWYIGLGIYTGGPGDFLPILTAFFGIFIGGGVGLILSIYFIRKKD
jgi:hypothetical protein